VKVLYFAWLRQRIGVETEDVSPPASVKTVAQLVAWLAERSAKHREALKDPSVVRVAVNQEYARPNDPVGRDDEVALFPPVTGGGG
jgi:molybdopterin converting factor subunit 1